MKTNVDVANPAAPDVELGAGEKRRVKEQEGRVSKRRKASSVVEALAI